MINNNQKITLGHRINIKNEREKHKVTYEGKQSIIITNTSMETIKARRAGVDVTQNLREKQQPMLLKLVKLSITIGEETTAFQDKVKFKQYSLSYPAL